LAVSKRSSVAEGSAPVSEVVATLSDGHKVKRRILHMRACNEKDEKGKSCFGHLKRWYGYGDEVRKQYGPDPEVYRCERCQTLYVPAEGEPPRTRTLSF
jgi:hypothetical protein